MRRRLTGSSQQLLPRAPLPQPLPLPLARLEDDLPSHRQGVGGHLTQRQDPAKALRQAATL